jgi:threonine aldolase
MNKKAQGEVITVILIILLVLAAIVIVWQVVNSTITKGSEQVESQSGCIGINIENSPKVGGVLNKDFVAKRSAQGGTFTSSDLAIIVDGVRLASTAYTLVPATNPLKSPLDTVTFTLTTAATDSVEVAVIGDGTTCPGTGLYNLP